MERGRDILALITPGTVWAVHFVLIYALISASCAPRGLIGTDAVWLWGSLGTLLALGLCLAPLTFSTAASTRRALLWCCTIAALAVLADGAFIFLFQSCGG